MTAALVVAVAAAISFGWSTAAMHNSAHGAPGGVQGMRSLLGHLLSQRLWLSGLIASLGGLVLHALALSLGSIVIVQPIIASGMLWSFGFSELLVRRRPPREMLLWAVVLAVGLALFLGVDTSTKGTAQPSNGVAIGMLTAGAVTVVACWLASRRGSHRRSGLWLGAAAGVVFGLIAGTLKATAAEHGLAALLTGWPLYVLCLLGAAGFSLNQSAYNKVPLAQSLPMINVVNPVVALVFGFAAYGERPSGAAWQLAVQIIGLCITLLAVAMLARVDATVLAPGRDSYPPTRRDSRDGADSLQNH